MRIKYRLAYREGVGTCKVFGTEVSDKHIVANKHKVFQYKLI